MMIFFSLVVVMILVISRQALAVVLMFPVMPYVVYYRLRYKKHSPLSIAINRIGGFDLKETPNE